MYFPPSPRTRGPGKQRKNTKNKNIRHSPVKQNKMPEIKLTSFGAAGEVTGSCHLLEVDGFPVLVDCGLFQSGMETYLKNWEEFPFDVKKIKAVILSHAHLDHCGRLPLLLKKGYKGKIYATPATCQLAEIILADNQEILSSKAREHNLPILYSLEDVAKTTKALTAINYHQSFKLNDKLDFTLYNAGHILGAAFIKFNTGGKNIVFSGDLGGQDMPLMKTAETLGQADYLILESTYGNSLHADKKNREKKLLQAVQSVTAKAGTLVISVFAMERTQDVLSVLNDYYESHLDFRVPVYLDSPLATAATKIYKQHANLLNQTALDKLKYDNDLFNFPHLKVTTNSRESKRINSVPPPKIVLAGSGMAEGGRLIHHLAHYASDPRNYILFMGFQVPGTLGHHLTHGAFDFDYYGKKIPLKASVDQIDGFSAHADQNELLAWIKNIRNQAKIYLVHSDADNLLAFQKKITEVLDIKAEIMKNNETVLLN